MTAAAPEPRFGAAFAGIVRGILRIGAARWHTLLAAGLIVFVPLGLLETLDLSVQEAVAERESETLIDWVELVGIGVVHAVGSLLGEVLFAGVVTAIVLVERGHRSSLRELIGRLSLGRLALADVLLVLVAFAGLLLLIVPGFVFLVWFALIGPVIEVEHRGVRDAFRRSRELVRRRFWLVAAFVIPLLMLDETLTGLAHRAAEGLFGESFAGEWAAGTLTGVLTSLPLALAAVVLFLELTEGASADRRSSPGTDPRASRRSHPAGTT